MRPLWSLLVFAMLCASWAWSATLLPSADAVPSSNPRNGTTSHNRPRHSRGELTGKPARIGGKRKEKERQAVIHPEDPLDFLKPDKPEKKRAPAGRARPARPPQAKKTSKKSSGEITRGPLNVLVQAQGSVRADEVFRINATIAGRVEKVFAKPRTWYKRGESMGYLLTDDFAALMDAKATTPGEIMEERWQKVYQPSHMKCGLTSCFTLKVYARPKRWVLADHALIEAARKLRLVGRIRPGDGSLIKKGQLVNFWPVGKPEMRKQARVERFIFDKQGTKINSGGTFTVLLNRRHYLDPGTEWEGHVVVDVKKDVLRIPTEALIRHGNEVFAVIRISTGITTYDITEIRGGASENQRYLMLDNARRGPIRPHTPPTTRVRPRSRRGRSRGRRAAKRAPAEFGVPRPKRRSIRQPMPKIEVFPDDIPEEEPKNSHDRFPSDILH